MGERRQGGRGPSLEASVFSVAKKDDMQKLSWPWWAPWALLYVAATSALTIAVTLYAAG